MSDKENFYSNRELFELMMPEIYELKQELKETRTIVAKYNGLRERLGNVEEKLSINKGKEKGKDELLAFLRDWGGWLVAFLMLLIYLFESGVL